MAEDTYELFRLSLINRRSGSLFEKLVPDRQDYISGVFSNKIAFDHHTTDFSFVPLATDRSTRVIVGKVGRAIEVKENAPPEQDFDEQLRETWKAAIIAIDPYPGKDGQKIAMLRDKQVGKPFSVLRSLLKQINLDPDAPYTLEVQPISDARTFRDFAKNNHGNITVITFNFVVPNGLWNTDAHIKDDLVAARETMNAETVSTTFKSDQGLKTDSPPIEEAISYIEKGSGTAYAKTRDGKTFSSTSKSKKAKLPYDKLSSPRSTLARALRGLATILDSEKDPD